MIKIVRTTMKKKMAGIMTESGIITFFEILCGVAQGDSPSGLIFILALEPLLWKLALDLGLFIQSLKTVHKSMTAVTLNMFRPITL